MNVSLTWETLSAVAGGIVTIIVVAFGVWKFFRAEVEKVETRVAENAKELANYKTHVAETYISKAGHRETTDQILRAIEGLGGRIDSLFQSIPAARRPRSGQD
ncbi:hypothetical protein A6U86_05330 [Rhizobium sp. AC27/96]|nr:hypothetical protein A6U86_05330 [Rhizobium sp. AC27/96]